MNALTTEGSAGESVFTVIATLPATGFAEQPFRWIKDHRAVATGTHRRGWATEKPTNGEKSLTASHLAVLEHPPSLGLLVALGLAERQ